MAAECPSYGTVVLYIGIMEVWGFLTVKTMHYAYVAP